MAIDLPLTSRERAAAYYASGQWRDETITERFLAAAARAPDKVAIVEGSLRLTYSELVRRVKRLAASFVRLGLVPGDVVAGQLPNGHEIPLMHLASNLVGLLFMPLHDTWRAVELRHLLPQAKVRLLVTPAVYRDFDHAEMIASIRADLPDLEHYFTLETFPELLTGQEIGDAVIAERRPDPDLPAAIMLSGGTTSISKISRFSSNNLLAMLDFAADAAHFGSDDIAAGIAPEGTGATGYIYGVLTPLLRGATSVILPKWGDPAEAVDLIIRERCTYGVAIPTQMTKMLPELETHDQADFAAFRCFANAGAPLPRETALRIETLMRCRIQSIYGATDGGTPTLIAMEDPQEKRLSTVGRVMRGCELQLWDDNCRPVPPGMSGEIVWRGADKSWGYLGDDAQTAAVFTADHFYRSGDLGELDAEGYLRVVGRIKDMVLRGGRNVSPRAIEEALVRHPDVADVAVAAMPDPVLGERACAFVVLKPGRMLELPDAVAFLKNEGLAVWQLPERLEVVDELPRGPGGKTLKNLLTARVTEKLRAEGVIP